MQMNLIRESKRPHSSPVFMVRKHSKIKREKTRMVHKFLGCLNYSSDFIKDLVKEIQEL